MKVSVNHVLAVEIDQTSRNILELKVLSAVGRHEALRWTYKTITIIFRIEPNGSKIVGQ
jgi:predicted RNA-binding protein